MSTTTDRPKVDAGALGSAMFADAERAMSSAIVLGFRWCEERDVELNDFQKEELLRAAFACMSGLEVEMTRTIVDDLERSGVQVWGFAEEMAKALGRDA